MRTRTPIRVLLTIALTLALLPMFSSLSPANATVSVPKPGVSGETRTGTASLVGLKPAAGTETSLRITIPKKAPGVRAWVKVLGPEPADISVKRFMKIVRTSQILRVPKGQYQIRTTTMDTTSGVAVRTVETQQVTTESGQVTTFTVRSPVDTLAAAACGAGTGPCAVGNTGPGGGVVFYDAGSMKSWGRYLEVAPARWYGSGHGPRIKWCVGRGQDGDVKTKTSIGSGAANTAAMLASCSSGAGNLAAAYRGGGNSDWFLPSKDELNTLYENKDVVGGLTSQLLWSPSQSLDWLPAWSEAWYHNFYNGHQLDGLKDDPLRVRPVRAF